MTIGERIKQRRLELGLSLDDIAHRLNKSRTTIYRYETSAISDMPSSVIMPLAVALETSPAQLMGWEEKELSVSGLERDVILAYRRAPESRREAVRTLLDIVVNRNKQSDLSDS